MPQGEDPDIEICSFLRYILHFETATLLEFLKMKRICVYCGSSPGAHPDYIKAAATLGERLAKENISLVYGGGSVGMMGVLANAAFKNGGHVIGVITRRLIEMEVAFTQLSDLRVVETMHERKAMMAELADGFIALPGGFGTMDEMFEVLTWSQLNIHQKPCGFLNINGYFDKLIDFIKHMISQQFVSDACKSLILTDNNPRGLLDRFHQYQPLFTDKGEWAKAMAKKKQSMGIVPN